MESRGSLIRSNLGVGIPSSVPARRHTGGSRKESTTPPTAGPDFVPLTISQQPKAQSGSIRRNVPVGSVHGNRTSGQSIRSGPKKLTRGASTESYTSGVSGVSGGSGTSVREKDKLFIQRQAEKVAREREERRLVIVEEIRKERVTMLIFSGISALCGLFWLIALSIDQWYIVSGKVAGNGTRVPGQFLWSRSGLWKICRIEEGTGEENTGGPITSCKYHALFPSEIKASEGMDQHVIDYQRTQISFAIISILLLPMAGFASFYTFRNQRYTYKRLTACLYFLLAITVLVVIEVVITSVSYEKVSVPYHHPKNSSFSYGFCFYVGWIVFLFFLVTAALFLAYSRKRKGDEALEDEDEEYFGGR